MFRVRETNGVGEKRGEDGMLVGERWVSVCNLEVVCEIWEYCTVLYCTLRYFTYLSGNQLTLR